MAHAITLSLHLVFNMRGARARIERIVWLQSVIDKLSSKHRVETNEVEEVFASRPKIRFVERGRSRDEDVYLALGQTSAGRYLAVLFIYK